MIKLPWLPKARNATGVEIARLLQDAQGRIHVGCNNVRVQGYVNVDVRRTQATDLVHDCRDLAIFPDGSVKFAFSNAFFEHLYVPDRLPFLRDSVRALHSEGWLAFTGLPDFEEVARAYLERREPGHVSPKFDLFEVYRYTHGDPEGRPSWWLAQLHKGLLDVDTVVKLLRKAGFRSGTVFRYCWGAEPYPVTFGFIAQTGTVNRDLMSQEVRGLLAALPTNINWNSVTVLEKF